MVCVMQEVVRPDDGNCMTLKSVIAHRKTGKLGSECIHQHGFKRADKEQEKGVSLRSNWKKFQEILFIRHKEAINIVPDIEGNMGEKWTLLLTLIGTVCECSKTERSVCLSHRYWEGQ